MYQLATNLRLQASTPSDHLWPTFLLPALPQFLNQVPPGAQQLTLPDFLNVPHLGHAIVLAIVPRTISSRTGIHSRRRDTEEILR